MALPEQNRSQCEYECEYEEEEEQRDLDIKDTLCPLLLHEGDLTTWDVFARPLATGHLTDQRGGT